MGATVNRQSNRLEEADVVDYSTSVSIQTRVLAGNAAIASPKVPASRSHVFRCDFPAPPITTTPVAIAEAKASPPDFSHQFEL